MAAVRTILAVLIAISVAMLLATGGAAVLTKPVDMSMAGHAQDVPCCPSDDCKGSTACALKCFNFIGIVPPDVAVSLPYFVDAALPSIVDSALRGHVSKPPTRPPPV